MGNSPAELSQAAPDGNCTPQSTNYNRRRQPATLSFFFRIFQPSANLTVFDELF